MNQPNVFFTMNGKKFHYSPTCQAIRRARGRLTGVIFEVGLQDARASGRTACTRCCPATLSTEEVKP